MNWWIVGGIVVAVVLLWLATRLGWIDLSNKSQRGSGGWGGLAGPIDEVFAPSRHEAQQEQDRQTLLPAPAPLPGDGAKDVWDGGKITLDLGADGRGQRVEGRAPTEGGRATDTGRGTPARRASGAGRTTASGGRRTPDAR
ncbi:hypothetical protein [Leifsonia poae]|uniref:Uncharacterized protein n=1 Tax=Leifsonia poae TaxID=110933 RepID=A0A9W6H9T9_9MICO|nr:hypothetical protein [Leifsonia poae]GLJ76089.1 hypothetical protein GCM10017584_16630 [Leifsonia poae]